MRLIVSWTRRVVPAIGLALATVPAQRPEPVHAKVFTALVRTTVLAAPRLSRPRGFTASPLAVASLPAPSTRGSRAPVRTGVPLTPVARTGAIHASARAAIDTLVDRWHRAAASADEKVFFGSMTPDAIYIGTDASERWLRPDFERWAMKYFQRKSAWSFHPFDRHIVVSCDGNTAWWDEHLHTWMGVCGGSGVAVRTQDGWRIAHYHLAVTVPNARMQDFIAMTNNPADRAGTTEHDVMQTVRSLFAAIGQANPVHAGALLDDGARIVRCTRDNGTASTESFGVSQFLETIVAPRRGRWEERAWDYRVRIDGGLASAWVRYGFYIDGALHHCGVDAFEMVQRGDGWKVVSLVYTRCNQECREPARTP